MSDTNTRHLLHHLATVLVLLTLASCAGLKDGDALQFSIVGTNDVHGELVPKAERGGLVTISGYVDALRAARGRDRVLLIDAGDMWQGTLESNLTEGATIVDVYNAMGYAAAAIGNHEFDFGPVGSAATPGSATEDPRGALKQQASKAQFPLLSANLFDTATNKLVDWANIQPSTIVSVDGIDIGIIGVMTENALRTTIAANTVGLEVLPLAESIRREAEALRAGGAALIIVAAHAGGRCSEFSNPADVSSCDTDSEIMRVANALPSGLVNHIFAGHVHDGIAHVVNDISITSSYSRTHAFSRVDFTIAKSNGRVLSRIVYPPQLACPYQDEMQNCVWQLKSGEPAARMVYEGRVVEPNAAVLAIARNAERRAAEKKQEKLGAHLDTPFTLKGNPESALGNLMTDALLDEIDGDVAIHNVSGGIRATLPAGELTFGAVYEMFPFDNHAVVLQLTGEQLRNVIVAQASKSRRRAGISGMRVDVDCSKQSINVEMRLADNRVVSDTDRIRVIVNDYLALGGDAILQPAMPTGGFTFDDDLPLVRDVLVNWFRGRGSLRADDFLTGDAPKWRVPTSCTGHHYDSGHAKTTENAR